jgi:hypothetical protein
MDLGRLAFAQTLVGMDHVQADCDLRRYDQTDERLEAASRCRRGPADR